MTITAICLGLLSLSAGILTLLQMPGIHAFGTTTGWSLSAAGVLLLVGTALCSKRRANGQRPFNGIRGRAINVPSQSVSTSNGPTFLDLIDPVNHANIAPPNSFVSPRNGNLCWLKISTLSKDVFTYIATFLRPRDLFRAMPVSKEFCAIMRSDIIWTKYLVHEDFRIWGATRWTLTHSPNGYFFSSDNTENSQINALSQLRAYHELKNKERIDDDLFLDYLARLMPGGPVAFKSIPQKEDVDTDNLAPADMPGPIMRGTNQNKLPFFALRLIDRSRTDAAVVTLIFVKEWGQWRQEANNYWQQNELKIIHENTLNYILALVSRKTFDKTVFNSALKKTVELI